MLLAYVVQFKDEEWCSLIHGETRAKAKYRFMRVEPSRWHDAEMWKDIRLYRLPKQDNLPFTFENAENAGFHYSSFEYDENGDEIINPTDFTNDCDCPICKEWRKL